MSKKLKEILSRHEELSLQIQDPKFIKDKQKYAKTLKEYAALEEIALIYREYEKVSKDLEENKKLLVEEQDKHLRELAEEEVKDLKEKQKTLENKLQEELTPKDPLEEKNVIVEIRSGAGGDEASLFVQEMFRAYSLFAGDEGWEVGVLSTSPGNSGGLKEVIFSLSGKGVFSLMKYESGVHRVQRIPKTESRGRIHTSTITVVVLPEADELDVTIDPKDLRIDVYRSSGHGGQSVNTTDSAVRITHIPSGLVVTSQDGKSQHSNKQQAMKVLYSRLYDLEIRKRQEEASGRRLAQIGTGDRSERVRTYNFPQSRITDHRINFSTQKLDDVLKGKIRILADPLQESFREESLKGEK